MVQKRTAGQLYREMDARAERAADRQAAYRERQSDLVAALCRLQELRERRTGKTGEASEGKLESLRRLVEALVEEEWERQRGPIASGSALSSL
jgi:hypothetical protein